MATDEPTANPPPLPSLPQYPELILAAIESVNDKNGASKLAISRYIEATFGILPTAHSNLLSLNLSKMKMDGQLIMVRNLYMKPDPNAPPRRGRGRPPKPKEPLPSGEGNSPSRPRGRPPKDRDSVAPVSGSEKETTPSKSGRKRGRPPKMEKTASEPSAAALVRPCRGRPPKPKESHLPGENETTPSKSGRKRGRPAKMQKTASEAPAAVPLLLPPVQVNSPSRPRGRPPKDGYPVSPVSSSRKETIPSKTDPNVSPLRGRGRPPKPKEPLSPDVVISPPRSRGRPPKVRDPVSTVSSPIKETIPSKSDSNVSLLRGRGCPPKSPPAEVISLPRSKGRPPKDRDPVSPFSSPRKETTPSKTDSKMSPMRGRGRPPKPKEPLLPAEVISLPWSRGRLPKNRDTTSPVSSPYKETAPLSSGRKRGRPAKMKNTASELAVVLPPNGTIRGRGRPPKVKPAVAAPVGD